MSNSSSKEPTTQSADNSIRYAFNDADKTLAVGSFVTGKLGHKITRVVVDSVTDRFDYSDNGSLLYSLTIIYTNSAHDDIVSVERTV